MPEIKTHRDHPASMAERVNKRLQNSGGDRADVVVKNGDGARRTYHNIHFGAGHVKPLDTRDRTIRETMHQKPPGAAK
jgi:hypothetical protein